MQFEHARKYLSEGDIVEVQCTHQCNVRLTDDSNFSKFKSRAAHRYFGGFYKMLPAQIVVPHTGNWNITIDLGGGIARYRYSINILKQS